MRRFALALTILAAMPAAAAQADHWSRPAAFDRPPRCGPGGSTDIFACFGEPAPRAAVTAQGAAVVAWVDLHNRVRAGVADRAGRFGRAATLGTGFRPAPAIAADGTVTVVWTDRGVLRYARRLAHGRFGAAHRLVPRGSKEGDDDAKVAAQPDGSVEVVYENSYRASGAYVTRVRAVTIDAGGRPRDQVTLGTGGFGHDSVRASADGTLAACCLAIAPDGPQQVVVHRPGGTWQTLDPHLGEGQEIETVAATRRGVAAGVVDVANRGDAGAFGTPGTVIAGADGVFGPFSAAPVDAPRRALQPTVAVDGAGRTVLVYQEKRESRAFSRQAPVYATVGSSGGARQHLDVDRDAYEPTVRPLRSGAIAAWETAGDRWRIAVERGGSFRPLSPPTGPGPTTSGEDFNYNRDLATAGRYAVLTWSATDGAVRVSELRAG